MGRSLERHAKKPRESLVKAKIVVEAQRLPSSLVGVELPVNMDGLVHKHEGEDTAMFTARLSLGDRHKK